MIPAEPGWRAYTLRPDLAEGHAAVPVVAFALVEIVDINLDGEVLSSLDVDRRPRDITAAVCGPTGPELVEGWGSALWYLAAAGEPDPTSADAHAELARRAQERSDWGRKRNARRQPTHGSEAA
jgi:hypothetical protein